MDEYPQETGGKQYKVQEGDIINIEKLEIADGETVGFDKALTDAGMQPAILLEGSDWQYDKSIQIANDLLDSGIDFDVVFTCNEYTYQCVNKVFKERGVTSKIIVSTNGHDDYWDDL